jgi:hypothetical protein
MSSKTLAAMLPGRTLSAVETRISKMMLKKGGPGNGGEAEQE